MKLPTIKSAIIAGGLALGASSAYAGDALTVVSWGGAYTQAPLGGEPIPLNSDIDFELEVMECNRVPEAAEMAYYYSYYADQHGQPRTTTMQPHRDFWLHLEESDHTANDMVLTE